VKTVPSPDENPQARPARSAQDDSVVRACIVLGCVALAVMAPELVWGLHNSDSSNYSIVWTRQFTEAWGRGELYPRWLPDSFQGLGAPTFYFYPPLAYVLTGAIHALGVEVTRALTLATTLLLFGSGLAMERWLRWRGTPSLPASALYMALPYRLMDIYMRGALAEHAAFLWLPLIALGIEALPRRWAAPLLAASVAGLLLTHLPTAVLALVFLMAPLGVRRVLQDRRTLAPGACAGLLGVGLAAFFLAPALTLQGYVQPQLLWTRHYTPSTWFVWNWDKETWLTYGPILASCIGIVLLAGRRRGLWLGMTVIATLAAFGLLPIIALPGLSTVQFPWRAVAVVLFTGMAGLAAAPPKRLYAVLGICLLLPGWFSVSGHVAKSIAHGERPQMAILERIMPDAPEYLPRGLQAGVSDLQHVPRLGAYSRYPRSATLSVTQPGLHTIGRAAFPIWRLVHDGRNVPYVGPLITFSGSPGEYRVERRWIWQEEFGAAVSAMALIGLIFMSLWAMRLDRLREGRWSPASVSAPS
jgi:hypothetical protein